MKSDNRRFIPEIDELRAIAALLVILYHGLQLIGARLSHGGAFDAERDWVSSNNPFVTLIVEGHSAVGLFIVLSGYILSVGAIGKEVDYSRFVLARVLRIYPVYLVLLAMAALTGDTDVVTLLRSILPVPLSHTTIVSSPFSSMFWAVLVEVQCYLLFPFLIAFSNKLGLRYLVGLIVMMIVLRAVAVVGMDANPRDLSYWTVVGRLDQFLIGMVLARLTLGAEEQGKWRSLGLLTVAITLALAMLWWFNRMGGWPSQHQWKIIWPDLEGLIWAFVIWAYISAGRFCRFPFRRLLQQFGLISYPVYLVHIAIIMTVMTNGLFVSLTGNPHLDALLTTVLIVVPLSAAIGTLLHHLIERPFLTLRPKYIKT